MQEVEEFCTLYAVYINKYVAHQNSIVHFLHGFSSKRFLAVNEYVIVVMATHLHDELQAKSLMRR